MIDKLNFIEVKQHYNQREEMHEQLRQDFQVGNINSYVENALGILDGRGNYSASEHGLGSLILSETSSSRVFQLAKDLDGCIKTSHIPTIIYKSNISYLKISVGSEMAMMLRPNDFWVGNVRTIWAHLLVKHDWKKLKANEELNLYKDNDRTSEMEYRVWRDLYLSAETNLSKIAELGTETAKKQKISHGKFKFLWADAIASYLYNNVR